MAWRPTKYLIEGGLENITPEKITGWMRFAGLKSPVTFDLEGDFHRDIRGTKICFKGNAAEGNIPEDAEAYMEGFAVHQTGKAGDITAGKEPVDYVDYPYYAELNIMLSDSLQAATEGLLA